MSVFLPLYTRSKCLTEELCSLGDALQGHYMLPSLAELQVKPGHADIDQTQELLRVLRSAYTYLFEIRDYAD